MPESGVPEQAFVKKYYRRSFALNPTPPLTVFTAHSSLCCPHNLNAKNRLVLYKTTWQKKLGTIMHMKC